MLTFILIYKVILLQSALYLFLMNSIFVIALPLFWTSLILFVSVLHLSSFILFISSFGWFASVLIILILVIWPLFFLICVGFFFTKLILISLLGVFFSIGLGSMILCITVYNLNYNLLYKIFLNWFFLSTLT